MDLKKAQTVALDLMKYHKLIGWSFQFDRSVTRLGICRHNRKIISLSIHATTVNSEEAVINTILHELAHALIDSSHGHDAVWRAKAIELGDDGERCGDIAVKAPAKHRIFCPSCNGTWNLYRLSKRYANRISFMWCKSCGKERSKGKLVLELVK